MTSRLNHVPLIERVHRVPLERPEALHEGDPRPRPVHAHLEDGAGDGAVLEEGRGHRVQVDVV